MISFFYTGRDDLEVASDGSGGAATAEKIPDCIVRHWEDDKETKNRAAGRDNPV